MKKNDKKANSPVGPTVWTFIDACRTPVLHGSFHRFTTSHFHFIFHAHHTSFFHSPMARSLRLLNSPALQLFLLFLLLAEGTWGGGALRLNRWDQKIWMPTDQFEPEEDGEGAGTRWAVLVAGSYGYGNYRHQVGFFIFLTFIWQFILIENTERMGFWLFAGWCLPCLSVAKKRRVEGWEYSGVYVWWHCQPWSQSQARRCNQSPSGWWCLCWCT